MEGSQHSRHDPRLASSRLHADVERLEAQAALSWPRELCALKRIGLRDGTSILEVGSGPGFITRRLLDALPHATVTCVELDADMVAHARMLLSSYPEDRLRITEGSITFTNLPSDAFDFALARYVFQHLSAPDLAASEILRLLKRGGTLAVLDVDDDLGGLVSPSLPAFDVVAQRVREAQARAAGDRKIGRKLWRILSDAGYESLNLEAVLFHSDEIGLEPFLAQYEPGRYHPFVGPCGLTMDEWERYRQSYAQLLNTRDAMIVQLLMLASGSKP